MEIKDFIDNFVSQFDDPESVTLTPETKFHELDDWNSLTGLMTIAMADEVYGVTLLPNQMREAQTVQDLFDLIKQMQG